MKIALKVLSAVFAAPILGAAVAAIPLSSVAATEECLATPKEQTPPGKHWYYRSERGTQRRCWYLREGGEVSSQAVTSSTPPRRAAPELVPDSETKPVRSAADAHAELPLPHTLVESDLKLSSATSAKSVGPRGAERRLPKSSSPETAPSQLASPNSEPTGQPLSPSLAAASAPDTNSDASPDTALAPKVPAVAPTRMGTSAIGTPASLRMLLLGTFGAIALSWLTGGAIMARVRRRQQRYTTLNSPTWPTDELANYASTPPSLEPVPANSSRALEADRGSSDRKKSSLGDNVWEIEHLLVRFANQARAEL